MYNFVHAVYSCTQKCRAVQVLTMLLRGIDVVCALFSTSFGVDASDTFVADGTCGKLC